MKIILVLFFLSFYVYPQIIPTTISEVFEGEIKLISPQNHGRVVGNWTQVTNMPYPRFYGASACYSRNDTTWLYIFGGDTTGNGDATKGCLRYNVNTDDWEYIDTLPIPMRVNSTARLGNKFYVMGGFDGRHPVSALKKFFEYDINTRVWSELPDLPDGIFYHQSFGYQDSLILIIGGVKFDSTVYLDKVLLFNTNTRTFREATPLPGQRASFALVPLNNTFYITGGLYGNDSLSNNTIVGTIDAFNHTIINYSISSDSSSHYPIQVHAHRGYPDRSEKITFFGGSISNAFSPVRSSFSYNIPENSYDIVSTFPYSTSAFQSGSSYSPDSVLTVVVAGGVVPGPSFTSETWVYRDTLTTTGLNNSVNNLPAGFVLYQNYPNPFNPSTTIRFFIPEQSFVKLEIFNILGEKILTLVSDFLSGGTYNYNLDISNEFITSGTYFYRLTSDGYSSSKKLLILK